MGKTGAVADSEQGIILHRIMNEPKTLRGAQKGPNYSMGDGEKKVLFPRLTFSRTLFSLSENVRASAVSFSEEPPQSCEAVKAGYK